MGMSGYKWIYIYDKCQSTKISNQLQTSTEPQFHDYFHLEKEHMCYYAIIT